MKKTKWFDGSVKPVRDGVYQRQDDTGIAIYSMFANGVWHWGSLEKECATSLSFVSCTQNAKWRGLAQNPEVKP